jgi:transcriptional regulator with XRE-family HTH domain
MSRDKADFEKVGERLKTIRKTVLGLSQADLAAKIGLRRSSSVSKLENGDQKVDISILEKYAKLANTSVSGILYENVEGREEMGSDSHLWSLFNELNPGEQKVAEMFFEILLSGDSQKRRELKGFILEAFDSIDQSKIKK